MKHNNFEYSQDKMLEWALNPSPLHNRICACGCDIEFQPNRIDQIYLNRLHANKAYNHGKRKQMHLREKAINKILKKNDDILGRFFALRASHRSSYTTYFDIIKAAGFDENHFVSFEKAPRQNDKYIMYHYCISFSREDERMIKIEKI
jgi:hypothetical protein